MDGAIFHLALIVLGLLAVQLGTLPGSRRTPRRSVGTVPVRHSEAPVSTIHGITR